MDAEHPRPSRLAIVFVLVGLALSAIGIAYLMSPAERELPPISASHDELRLQQLNALLLRMLTHSFLIFLAFLVGSYVMVRVGRRVLSHREPPRRSEYVDAWSNYRLSQDEIDTATARLDDDFPPDLPPGGRGPVPEVDD
jgi:hypothetical protein